MKVLLLDIETAPHLGYVWGIWQQNIAINQIKDSGYTLCWAASWYGEDHVYFDSIHESKPRDMIVAIHEMLDEADVVVHYNGTKFDIPTLNREFLLHGLTPPSPFKEVDLLKVVKNRFRFPSNKLEYVVNALGLGKKFKHAGFELWPLCMAGDHKAWAEMENYNIQDVLLLEKLYDRLKPWIKSHPNWGLYGSDPAPVCPSCGSVHLHRRGTARTAVSIFARYQCQDCGAWSRTSINENKKKLMRQA
jgi:DNA polymerase elongation subunit (family B)